MSKTYMDKREVEIFKDKFDGIANTDNYSDLLELFMLVMHNEEVQKIVTDKYLEDRDYSIDDLEKRGSEFLKEALKQTKTNE